MNEVLRGAGRVHCQRQGGYWSSVFACALSVHYLIWDHGGVNDSHLFPLASYTLSVPKRANEHPLFSEGSGVRSRALRHEANCPWNKTRRIGITQAMDPWFNEETHKQYEEAGHIELVDISSDVHQPGSGSFPKLLPRRCHYFVYPCHFLRLTTGTTPTTQNTTAMATTVTTATGTMRTTTRISLL